MSQNNLSTAGNPINKTSVYAAVGFVSGAAVLFSCLTPVIIGAFAGELAFSESQLGDLFAVYNIGFTICLLYTSPSPRDRQKSRMPSSA